MLLLRYGIWMWKVLFAVGKRQSLSSDGNSGSPTATPVVDCAKL